VTPGASISLRPAAREDVPVVARLIRALAEYERLADECLADEAALETHLFGPRPYAEVLIAEVDGEPAGFALFFHNYSTFLTKPGIYLEDLSSPRSPLSPSSAAAGASSGAS